MKQKLGTLFIVSALALAGIGVSYAGLSDVLTIAGTVQTASVTFDIQEYSGTWVWKVFNAPDTGYGPETVVTDDPEVTYNPSEGFLVAYAVAAAGVEPTDVQVTFNNIFPCIPFVADIEFTIGTIPVKFTAVTIQPNPGSEWMAPLIASGDIFAKLYVVREGVQIPVVVGTQIHPGEIVIGEIHIHLPQLQEYQGVSGSGTATLEILQWNDECEEQAEPKVVVLPEGVINFKAWLTNYYGGDLYSCIARLYNLPPGEYNVVNMGLYTMWCFEEGPIIYVGTSEGNAPQYSAVLYSSYDPMLPAEFQDPDWDLVNWIINHKGDYSTATSQDIQEAIWFYIDGGNTPSTSIGQQIVNDAALYGEGFIPEAGQFCAVVVDVTDPVVQDVFIEVDP